MSRWREPRPTEGQGRVELRNSGVGEVFGSAGASSSQRGQFALIPKKRATGRGRPAVLVWSCPGLSGCRCSFSRSFSFNGTVEFQLLLVTHFLQSDMDDVFAIKGASQQFF